MPKVLIVEPDDRMRHSIVHVIDDRAALFTATSAEDAKFIVEEQNLDIVLAEYILPGLNGLVFFEWLEKVYPNIRRVLMSGDKPEQTHGKSVVQRLTHAFLHKPFQAEELLMSPQI